MADRFDEFWGLCPRKKGKGAARRAWARATRSTDEDTLIDAMRRFRQECIGKEPEFICHPATWLNQERWEDEPDQVVKPSEDAVLQSRAWKTRRGEYIPPPDERERMEKAGYL